MSHNHQKKIALINDLSGFGRCSIAVALPILSMLKVQCCPVPTSIFTNHTGFESFYYSDYTKHMPHYIDEWKKLDLRFDGICSGDITVIEAIPEKILPELLPFIIQNDALFDFAVGKSAGSLSPRVKWEHLKNYSFELPDMEEQRRLAKVLWAMDATKKAYQKLIQKTDELVKSKFAALTVSNLNLSLGLEIP